MENLTLFSQSHQFGKCLTGGRNQALVRDTFCCARSGCDSEAHKISNRKHLGETRALEMSEAAPLAKTPSVGGYFIHHHLCLWQKAFSFVFLKGNFWPAFVIWWSRGFGVWLHPGFVFASSSIRIPTGTSCAAGHTTRVLQKLDM